MTRPPLHPCLCVSVFGTRVGETQDSQEIQHTVAAEPCRVQSYLVSLLPMHTFPGILVSATGKPPPTSLYLTVQFPPVWRLKKSLAIYTEV